MTDRPRRKWAEIQVDLFKEAARRHADEGSRARFEELFARMVPPIRPRGPGSAPPDGAGEPGREPPRGPSGKPGDRD
jgi:hypothetical protein